MGEGQSSRAVVDRIARLRGLRARARGAATIAPDLGATVEALARRRRSLGAVGELWGSVLPPALASRAWPESWRAGVLTVRASDAGAAFEFDRWLRSGGAAALRRAGVRRARVAPWGG